MIPERVTALTLAVYNKNKNREFQTPVGNFYYYYLPKTVYPYGIVREMENDQSYLIATAEKAVCDALYKARDVTSRKDLETLLLVDWRIDEDKLFKLDKENLGFLVPLYQRKIHKLFWEWYNLEGKHA